MMRPLIYEVLNMSIQTQDNAELKSHLMEIVRKAVKETTLPKMYATTGLLTYQGSQLRRGEDPMISLERLISICRALGHTITVTVECH